MRWGTSQPLFIEVPAASQETQRSCICVLGVSILLLFWRFFLLEFGTVSTVCYCLFVMLFSLFIISLKWIFIPYSKPKYWFKLYSMGDHTGSGNKCDVRTKWPQYKCILLLIIPRIVTTKYYSAHYKVLYTNTEQKCPKMYTITYIPLLPFMV